MKTLGLIGGTSWHSTVEYYRIINQQVNDTLGGSHSARMLLYSVNFEELKPPADWNGWMEIADKLTMIARKLEIAGAEAIVICSNTPHIVAHLIEPNITVPLINIVEETAKQILLKNLKTVALLGTKFTMEQGFFRDKLLQFHINTLIPENSDREFIHTSIYSEFANGIFIPATKTRYLEIIDNLKGRGAEGVVFGCTEIPLLIRQHECSIPIFDTTLIHSTAAVEFALRNYSIDKTLNPWN